MRPALPVLNIPPDVWRLLGKLSIYAPASTRVIHQMLTKRFKSARTVETRLFRATISLQAVFETRVGHTPRQWHTALTNRLIAAGLSKEVAPVMARGCLNALERWQVIDWQDRFQPCRLNYERLTAWVATHNKLTRAFGWLDRCVKLPASIQPKRTLNRKRELHGLRKRYALPTEELFTSGVSRLARGKQRPPATMPHHEFPAPAEWVDHPENYVVALQTFPLLIGLPDRCPDRLVWNYYFLYCTGRITLLGALVRLHAARSPTMYRDVLVRYIQQYFPNGPTWQTAARFIAQEVLQWLTDSDAISRSGWLQDDEIFEAAFQQSLTDLYDRWKERLHQ